MSLHEPDPLSLSQVSLSEVEEDERDTAHNDSVSGSLFMVSPPLAAGAPCRVQSSSSDGGVLATSETATGGNLRPLRLLDLFVQQEETFGDICRLESWRLSAGFTCT